jgi:hypothetical protein
MKIVGTGSGDDVGTECGSSREETSIKLSNLTNSARPHKHCAVSFQTTLLSPAGCRDEIVTVLYVLCRMLRSL